MDATLVYRALRCIRLLLRTTHTRIPYRAQRRLASTHHEIIDIAVLAIMIPVTPPLPP
ncbi:hypothetical protein PILCRDRAFT_506986 [Piloderma croceum F 1598]|uniref:Uncharacterized protein n=1 Tax=Piloderma croceum (strain F 1598) TaxID=765440 RepID=A0A0C3FNG4_PILCF|nr:hypothetical protein PILCRDRAFT_506986 [Piloderma croceum F 1598]